MRKVIWVEALLAISLLTLGSAPALAQSAPADMKCFIVSNMFAKSATDERAKEAAAKASFFYLGRLAGTAAAVEAAIDAQGKTITPQNAGPQMQACAQSVEQKVRELQQIGQRLSRRERK